MSFEVVNSFNFFFDSERDRNAQSTGDDLTINLNETPITCSSNQFLRLSLQEFSMYNNSTTINTNNNVFRITCKKTGTTVGEIINKPHMIFPYNPPDVNSLALSLGASVAAAVTGVTGVALSATNPIVTLEQSGAVGTVNGDNFIRVKLTFAAAHLVERLVIKTFVEDGDSFEILGADRIYDIGTTTLPTGGDSMLIDTTSSTTEITIKSFYPAQLSSQQNTYLKTNLNSTALQTKSYSSKNTDRQADGAGTESSKILGRIVNNTEFNTFTTQTNMEYFIDLTSRSLNFIQLFIEDSHGRAIPPAILYNTTLTTSLAGGIWSFSLDYSGAGTAGNKQNTLGNRSFEGALKVDVCQYTQPRNNTLQSPPVPNSFPPRYTSNLLSSAEKENNYLNRF